MKFLLSLLFDAIVLVSLLLAILWGDERLLNVGYFAGWFFGVVNLLCMTSTTAQGIFERDYEHRSLFRRGYDVLTDVAFTVLFVWNGWFVMAAVYALQAVCKAQMVAKQERRLSAPVATE